MGWELLAVIGATLILLLPTTCSTVPIDEWTQLVEAKAAEHSRWEHLVRRSVEDAVSEGLTDDTAHIQDIQAYYRDVFASESGWRSPLDAARIEGGIHNLRIMESLQSYLEDDNAARSETMDVNAVPVQEQKAIKGRYIVTMAPGTTDGTLDRTVTVLEHAAASSEGRLRADHIVTFKKAGRGFTATLSSKVVELLRKHPSVASVEEDIAIRKRAIGGRSLRMRDTKGIELQTGNEETTTTPEVKTTTTTPEVKTTTSEIPWNLDRLDQHSSKLDGTYNPEGLGSGVDVFIVDTGIRFTHEDFEGRAKYFGIDMIDLLTGTNLNGADCNGHGSHVAGIVGGKKYGVAKGATLYSVRALNCEGTGAVSGVVTAMDRIVSFKTTKPKVISLSLGVETSTSLNNALREVVNTHGVTAVAASGNDGLDSCNFSPSSSAATINVAATDRGDEAASFSNTGACVDVFAPGKMINSVGSGCDTCSRVLSGTSMACPHVTGYVAILLGLEPNLTPAQVKAKIANKSTKNAVGLNFIRSRETAAATPNRFLYIPSLGAEDIDTAPN